MVSAETLEIKVVTPQVIRWLFKGQGMMASLSEEMREGLLSRLLKAFYSQISDRETVSLAEKVETLFSYTDRPLTAFLGVDSEPLND